MKPKEVAILLVEDDDIEIEATTRAFEKQRIANPIVIARNGEEALDILRGQNGKETLPRPYIILLDLNMPRMGGLEFLEHVRDDPDLTQSVVFVLTTSDAHIDQWAAYQQHVAGYVVKQNVGEDFMNMTAMLDNYWKIVELPVPD